MASNKVLYAVRMPSDLKRLIDSAAKSGGGTTSQLVIAACWKYLDGGSSKHPESEPVMGRNTQKDTGFGARDASAASVTAVGDSQPRPDMAALRSICTGEIIPANSTPIGVPIEVKWPLCPHKEWAEDGEQYRCRLQAGHKGKCAPGERVS